MIKKEVLKRKNPYDGTPKPKILKIYAFTMKTQIEKGIGQRLISKEITKEFNVHISENTISGWLYHGNIPFAQQKTQFKALNVPEREELYSLYKIKNFSASEIAQIYQVSTIVIIQWLRFRDIKTRTHLESMNNDDLRRILSLQKIKTPPKSYSLLTPEKAYLLAVLAGDGHINPKNIQLEIKKDIEFTEEFSRCLKEVYGFDYKVHYYVKRDTYRVYAASRIICKDLLEIGDFRTYSWRVPELIENTKDLEITSSYIKGMFDSEGSVSKYRISMVSVSKEGIHGIQKLLLKLGISSKISLLRKKYYSLVISRKENLKQYKEKIGFTIKRKHERIIW